MTINGVQEQKILPGNLPTKEELNEIVGTFMLDDSTRMNKLYKEVAEILFG